MDKKLKTIFLVIILCLVNIVIVPKDVDVKADPENQEYTRLDNRYIRNITTNLSDIIFQAYNNSELHKGREFGSKGEHQAASFVYSFMQSLNLNPVMEQIQVYPTNQIDDKLEVLSKGIKINGIEVENFISPRWNDAYF